MCIRRANIEDYERLCSIDPVAATNAGRRDQIRNWLETAECCVAVVDGELAGYGVLTHHFFGQPFLELVNVGPEFRRRGLATAIIGHIQSANSGPKLFSSTNLSNRPMQQLFSKMGFRPSGYIDNLDEGDPEIIFLRSNANA